MVSLKELEGEVKKLEESNIVSDRERESRRKRREIHGRREREREGRRGGADTFSEWTCV